MQTVLVPRTEKQIRRLVLGVGVATALLTFAVLGGLALACEPFESMPPRSTAGLVP